MIWFDLFIFLLRVVQGFPGVLSFRLPFWTMTLSARGFALEVIEEITSQGFLLISLMVIPRRLG